MTDTDDSFGSWIVRGNKKGSSIMDKFKKTKLGGIIAVASMIGVAIYSNIKSKGMQKEEVELIDISEEVVKDTQN